MATDAEKAQKRLARQKAQEDAAAVSRKSPQEVFESFDTDGSGLIDMEEFKEMLPALGIVLSEAKTLKYFRLCDADESGEIDFDEFQTALFACDPVSGNTTGFSPNQLLTPLDAFEMFDGDQSGQIDEDEFALVLEYLGIKIGEGKIEKWFRKYDKDRSGYIDYDEFKQIWLRVANVKQQLLDRGVKVSKVATRYELMNKLEILLAEEEAAEAKALAQARGWRAHQQALAKKQEAVTLAEERAEDELSAALDAAGQVYMFGSGSTQQFNGAPVVHGRSMLAAVSHSQATTKMDGAGPGGMSILEFVKSSTDDGSAAAAAALRAIDGQTAASVDDGSGLTRVRAVWHRRVTGSERRPRWETGQDDGEETASVGTARSSLASSALSTARSGGSGGGGNTARSAVSVDSDDSGVISGWRTTRSLMEKVGSAAPTGKLVSPFHGVRCCSSTAALWGRRVVSASVGTNTAFVLTDMGEAMCWGGHGTWWTEDAAIRAEAAEVGGLGKWGEIPLDNEGTVTERSRLCMGTSTIALKRRRLVVEHRQVRAQERKDKRNARRRARDEAAAAKKAEEEARLAEERAKKRAEEAARMSAKALQAATQRTTRQKLMDIARAATATPSGQDRRMVGSAVAAAMTGAGGSAGTEAAAAGGGGQGEKKAEGGAEGGRAEMAVMVEGGKTLTRRQILHSIDLKLQALCQYYGHYDEPHDKKPETRILYWRNVVLPRVSYQQLRTSCELRQRSCDNLNKEALINGLVSDMTLEQREYGPQVSTDVRGMEKRILAIEAAKKKPTAETEGLRHEVSNLWQPLRAELQAEEDKRQAEVEARIAKEEAEAEHRYRAFRRRVVMAREDVTPEHTERGKSLAVPIGGMTRRGAELITPRGGSVMRAVSAGGHHVAAIHHNGTVYTWGCGVFGRLGLGDHTQAGAGAEPQPSRYPTLVDFKPNSGKNPAEDAAESSESEGEAGRRHRWSEDGSEDDSEAAERRRLARRSAVMEKEEMDAERWWLRAGNAQGARADRPQPTLVTSLQNENARSIAAGFTHTLMSTGSGKVFVWGGATSGKLGLGAITEPGFECYCPSPVRLRMPGKRKVLQVAAGNAHSAAVTTDGELLVWGCGDGGRLGLGADRMEPALTPQLVTFPQPGLRVAAVGCGCSHTVVVTEATDSEGLGLDGVPMVQGGQVYAAGAAWALGKFSPAFKKVQGLEFTPVRGVACGYAHTALVAVSGELWTWGSNRNGGCGHPTSVAFVNEPAVVPALYLRPRNLAMAKVVSQCSTYGVGYKKWHKPEKAVNGDRRGDGEAFCTHTQFDRYAWWQVDLGAMANIEQINVWNRTDVPSDENMPQDMFTKRLFPFVVMVSMNPLGNVAEEPPEEALQKSEISQVFRVNKRCSTWVLPASTVGRYVRVQLLGRNYLTLAEVEVFGRWGRGSSKVTSVACGRDTTVAVCRPSPRLADVKRAYKRAVKADPHNAMLLRQYETYYRWWDTFQRGGNIKRCMLCRGGRLCEVCELKESWKDELKDLPPGPGGRLRRLNSLSNILLSKPPPPLDWVPPPPPPKRGVKAGAKRMVRGFGKLFGSVNVDELEAEMAEAEAAEEAREQKKKSKEDALKAKGASDGQDGTGALRSARMGKKDRRAQGGGKKKNGDGDSEGKASAAEVKLDIPGAVPVEEEDDSGEDEDDSDEEEGSDSD